MYTPLVASIMCFGSLGLYRSQISTNYRYRPYTFSHANMGGGYFIRFYVCGCVSLFRHSNRGLITKGTIGSPLGKRPPFAKRVQNIWEVLRNKRGTMGGPHVYIYILYIYFVNIRGGGRQSEVIEPIPCPVDLDNIVPLSILESNFVFNHHCILFVGYTVYEELCKYTDFFPPIKSHLCLTEFTFHGFSCTKLHYIP